ncbi:MCE family protein [soil metagenome]
MRAALGRHRGLSVALLVAALLAGYLIKGHTDPHPRMTVYFTQVKGLYVGDDVDMLGVRIGKVVDIEPEPTQVKVTIEIDSGQLVPADAKAVLVAPSLVSVRHVALAPVYAGGPQLQDGDSIPVSRTAVPVEWDEVKTQLVRLTRALGPRGANSDGALSHLLDTSARNLDGQGANLNTTIKLLSEAMETLADSGGDVFGTVRNLDVFVEALRASDQQVVQFNRSLTSVAGILAQDRDDLAAALSGIDTAFVKVRSFIRTNRRDLTASVEGLGRFSNLLARNRQKLADILQVAPGTISNFYNIYDPDLPGLTGSFALPNLESPAMFICSAVFSLGGTPAQCEAALQPVAQYLSLPFPPISGGSPQTPGGDHNEKGGGAGAGSGLGLDGVAPGLIDELGGLLGGQG